MHFCGFADDTTDMPEIGTDKRHKEKTGMYSILEYGGVSSRILDLVRANSMHMYDQTRSPTYLSYTLPNIENAGN